MALVYHLALIPDWEVALKTGVYAPVSLESEGFVHASSREELIRSAEIHFPQSDTLIVLSISEKKVKHLLKWEPGREGKLFPHIYGKLPLERIENSHLLIRNEEGKWEWQKG